MGTNPGFSPLAVKNQKEVDDVYDYGYSLTNSLKRLDESKILSEGDKELIREFLEHPRTERVSTENLAKFESTIRRLTEHLGSPPQECHKEEHRETLHLWVQRQGYSSYAIQDSFFASGTSTSSSAGSYGVAA
jgi:hypothetical protein